MTDQMDQIEKTTRRYMYDDGLFEMATGLLLLIVGLGLFAWMAFIDISSTLGILLISLIFVLAIGGGLMIRKAVEAV